MSSNSDSRIDRRRFLKMIGAAGGATALGSLAVACGSSQSAAPAKPADSSSAKPAGTQTPAASNPAPAGKGKVARMAAIFPPTGAAANAATEFTKWIADKTKGELTVQVFPGGQLGAERDMVESVQLGSVEIGVFGLYPAMNITPEWGGVLGVPYLFRDQDHFRKVLDGPIGKPMRDALVERKGIHHIVFTNRGPRYLTSNHAVTTPADLKDIKMRVPEIDVYMAAWKMLGATVTPMAITEIFMALKQGTINGQESNYETIYNNSFFEVQKYLNLTGHTRDAYDIAVSEKWFKTLSPDLQKTLTEGLMEMGKLQDKLQEQDEAGYESKLKEKGMTFHQVEIPKFQEALKDLPKQFTSKWKAGFYDEVANLK